MKYKELALSPGAFKCTHHKNIKFDYDVNFTPHRM